MFTSWGTICWLPDVRAWGRVIASLLKPGGEFYFVDFHPAAAVMDDETGQGGRPGWFAPYFHEAALEIEDVRDYANPTTVLANARTHQFIHPVGEVVQALIDAGLRITMLHEHPTVAWPAFASLVEVPGRLYAFPDKPWLPLSYSINATRAIIPIAAGS